MAAKTDIDQAAIDAYIDKIDDVQNRYNRMEGYAVKGMNSMLRQAHSEVTSQLTAGNLTEFGEFRLRSMQENLNRIIATFNVQAAGLMKDGLIKSTDLGEAMVTEPMRAAGFEGLPAGFFQPTRAQLNVLVDYSADLISNIGIDMRTKINGEIRNAGLGVISTGQAMKNITQHFGFPATARGPAKGIAFRAETVMRTEFTRAFSVAGQSKRDELEKDRPGLQKQWMAAGDDRTRQSHLDAHGQVVLNNETFTVQGEQLAYPGDPAGSASNTINCRCTVVTIPPGMGRIRTPRDEKIFNERVRRSEERKLKEEKAAQRAKDALRRKGEPVSAFDHAAAVQAALGKKVSAAELQMHPDFPSLENIDPAVVDFFAKGLPAGSVKGDLTSWNKYDNLAQAVAKGQIAEFISQDTGIPIEMASNFLKTWAYSSNDTSWASLHIQNRAAQVFETELSPYQQAQWHRAQSNRKRDTKWGLRWREDDPSDISPFEQDGTGGLTQEVKDAGYRTVNEATDAALRSMYRRTQQELEAAGIDSVVLYRGVTVDTVSNPGVKKWQRGDEVTLDTSALESYAGLGAKMVADDFAQPHSYAEDGFVIRVEVPRERILSTARTGFGCMNEREFVVIGGSAFRNDSARIARTNHYDPAEGGHVSLDETP